MEKKTGWHENQKKNWDHPEYCIVLICQIIQESPRDLWRFTATQTPEKKKVSAANTGLKKKTCNE